MLLVTVKFGKRPHVSYFS